MFKIELYKKNLNIGHITFSYDNNNIVILSLDNRNQTVEKILIINLLKFIITNIDDAQFTKKISVDDCSIHSLTKKSVYYKMGFRILNKRHLEIMRIDFLKPMKKRVRNQFTYNDNYASIIHFKTIIEYYKYLINKNKNLSKINSFKYYKLNETTSEFEII